VSAVEAGVKNQTEVVRTQLEDLQAEFEAGARQLDVLADRTAEMRDELQERHLEQASLAGVLVRRVAALRESVRQQRERLRELRRAIRNQSRWASQHRTR
jgi:hypothetical protein